MDRSKEMLYMAKLIGMCQRADMRSQSSTLPKDQRDFHTGRREGYLKALAEFMEVEVAEIRESVLGSTPAKTYRMWVDELTKWSTHG